MSATHTNSNFLELFGFRETAWDPIIFRKHEIRKVYVSEVNKNDISVFGIVTLRLKSGKMVVEGFGANFILTEQGLIEKYQAWFVSCTCTGATLGY